ncbi:MAG TPA: hypothetical protein VFR67_16655, partial [Pilimelia sp.]|nr:hypothetical protein [Pilimelia sp.]
MVGATDPATAPRLSGIEPGRPVASYRTNLVTALLGTWFTVGLFLDAWAHNNKASLETFFTPWHGVFYSGFAATAGWIAWTIWRNVLKGRTRLAAVPVGYGASLVALVGFAVAGLGDLIWHTVYGIEQDLDILFSPTHLGLIASMFVIVTTPVRAAWADRSSPAAPGLRRLLPAVLSVALATTLVLLSLQYANALVFQSGDVLVAMAMVEEGFTATVVSSMAMTNLLLIVPLLTMARRWELPLGTATILYLAAGSLAGAITGFANEEMIIGFLIGGVCVDVLARWLHPTPWRLARYRTFAGLAPLATWAIYIATAYATTDAVVVAPPEAGGGQASPVVELYTGVPVVQALLGL